MNGRSLKIFFSGIGGSGVSAIAGFMADKGHIVVGSDRSFITDKSHPAYKTLLSKGIKIVPQDGSGIDKSFDLVVFSTAVEPDQPEVVKAKALGIPLKTRPEYLSEIVSAYRTIAIAGTSGKSTASGMLAFLMQRLGMAPNFIGGGRVRQFKTKINPGNSITGSSRFLVVEACESDGTIVKYKPEQSVILNLDLDHHSVKETSEMFDVLCKNTTGNIVLNADDTNLDKISVKKAITFSIDNQSDYQATDVIFNPFNTNFKLHGTKLRLGIPGKYNLYNALSCLTVLSGMAVPLDKIAAVLPEFEGIERRFDVHLNNRKHLVIDDYAHNPHKIAALMEAVKGIKHNICFIFQPHGFGPVRMMKDEYIRVFSEHLRNTDHLILLPIFYAGGTVSKDISSGDLAVGIMDSGKSVDVISRRTEVLDRIDNWDNYVVFGARDETLAGFAKDIALRLK